MPATLPNDRSTTSSGRRISWLIGLTTFATYAYFQPGGGWNQNVRFDQVRSLVEAGVWEIDDYAVYEPLPAADGSQHTRRRPGFHAASMPTAPPFPNSGDLSYFGGRVYPNKPPGATLLAAPAHAAVHAVQRAVGTDPDDWWPMTVALWCTTLGSVGMLGAAAAMVFHRLSHRLFLDVRPAAHVGATLAFALGTLMLPFGTMMFDHVPVAAMLLMIFSLVYDAPPRTTRLLAAGLLAGLAIVTNYTAVVPIALILCYAVSQTSPRVRRDNNAAILDQDQAPVAPSPRTWLRRAARITPLIALGTAAPLAFLAWYHHHCFGGALTPSYVYQSDIFLDRDHRFLHMFSGIDPSALWRIIIHPHWGLLTMCPIIIMALYGLWRMFRDKRLRVTAVLIAANFVAMLLINASFNGWHGGYSMGPRYLIPAIPFLCLPLALAFDRLPRLTTGVAIVSTTIMLLGTVVQPMLPMLPDCKTSPVIEFWLPLAAGRTLDQEMAVFEGPVSAGPRGVCEWGFPRQMFPPGSTGARWNAFTAGEFLHPVSWLSLWPLAVLWLIAGWLLHHTCRRPLPM